MRWLLSHWNRPARPRLVPGCYVELKDESGCIVPAGRYWVSKVNPDGSFHVGGNTAVWPRRLISVNGWEVKGEKT